MMLVQSRVSALLLVKLLVLTCCAYPASGHQALAEKNALQGYLRATAEVQHESLGNKDSVIGERILGILLWCLASVFLWNNERIAIEQYEIQSKAERYAVHIEDYEKDPIEELDGRIVYVTGESSCSQDLADDEFKGVKSEGKIKLRRIAEMYQNIERERQDDLQIPYKRYIYSEEWCDTHQVVNHDKSKKNPPMPIESTRRQDPSYCAAAAMMSGNGKDCAAAKHENVKFGAYYLGDNVIRELNNWEDKKLDTKLVENHSALKEHGKPQLASDGYFYYGDKNRVGAVRVKFEELHPGPLTLVGVLAKTGQGWTFVPIVRPDAAGTGDSLCAEIGGSCCFRVKELHFTGDSNDADFKEDLDARPKELQNSEMSQFHKCTSSKDVTYSAEALLASKLQSLEDAMADEGSSAAQRHHMARISGWILLTLGSLMIIDSIIGDLTMKWLVAMLGCGIYCTAMCCSFATTITIISVSWIAHRPFLASAGIASAVLVILGFNAASGEGQTWSWTTCKLSAVQ